MGGKCAGAGRRAHSSVSFVRPSGSAHRRSSESPSSRARLIGDDRAGRAYHRSWSRTEACRRTAVRLRVMRSTCRPMQWRSRKQYRRGRAQSLPGAVQCAGGLPGRAHQLWPATTPCPSAEAGKPEPVISMVPTRKCVGKTNMLSGVVYS